MENETKELLKEIKAYRNEMVAGTIPINKSVILLLNGKIDVVVVDLRLVACIGWHKLTEEQYKKIIRTL